MARKNKKNHEGEIYRVSPEHVVKKKNLEKYKTKKGDQASNPRPVMVGIQRSGKRVQISELTSSATRKHVQRKQRVKLEKTYPNRDSYVDTNTIGKSRLTNKPFKIGTEPLIHKNKVVNSEDLKKFKEARKKRGR